MKVLLLAIFSLYITSSLYAQTSDAEAEAMANLLGVQKKEAISKMVAVAPKDSVAFWKIYDEYAKKNVTTGKARIKLYEQTVQSYGGMSAATADSLATKYFANRMDQEKTLEEYYLKIKKATNAVTAFEFYQSEVYLLTQIRAQIMQQIPTYGQVQLATKKQ
ncbi:hypothetical protein [Pinibacter aurantiacus]|uniref:Uncharacterized protein n=1 Tax=Pinibacter aurantiacus TaxID=2851599 RepID=A0A9E2W3L7_9BACT|nr:hypothetical protein [Pinibacter aurantiacus]MBV4356929.1 hypothetical protein [Pinibacter aurantiacus]